jgi:hypothetical protein
MMNGRDSRIDARMAIARELGDRPMVAEILARDAGRRRVKTYRWCGRGPLERFADRIGVAKVLVYVAALTGAIVAVVHAASAAAWLFLAAMSGAAVTLLLIGIFRGRLNG